MGRQKRKRLACMIPGGCRGFSFTEMMVAVFIFTIIAAGLYAAAVASEKYWAANKAKIELQQDLRTSIGWMINDLRQAGNSSIANVPADGNTYSTITFKIPSGVTAGSLDWNAASIQFVVGGSGNNELERIQNGVTKIISPDINWIHFTRTASDPNLLQVAMEAAKKTDSGLTITYDVNFEVRLRND